MRWTTRKEGSDDLPAVVDALAVATLLDVGQSGRRAGDGRVAVGCLRQRPHPVRLQAVAVPVVRRHRDLVHGHRVQIAHRCRVLVGTDLKQKPNKKPQKIKMTIIIDPSSKDETQ